MLLSVNLQGLEQLTEYPDREIVIAERLEFALSQLYENARMVQSQDLDLIYRQLSFVREEKNRIRGRRTLLIGAHETLTNARFSFDVKLAEAKKELRD